MNVFKFLLLFAVSLFALSCSDIDGLSDNNKVESFKMEFYSDNIKLGDVVVDESEHTITIPVIYGKYNFPLKLKANITTSPEIDKILDIDFSEHIIFESVDEEKVFYVVAQSGKTQRWTIKLDELPRSENNYIEAFTVGSFQPKGSFYAANALIDEGESLIRIFVVNPVFPLVFVPEISVPDSASFENFKPGYKMRFNNTEELRPIKVVASSGKVKVWNVKIENPQLVTDFATVEGDQKENLSLKNLKYKGFSEELFSKYDLDYDYIDNKTGHIRFGFKAKDINESTAISSAVKVDFDISEYSQLMGFDTIAPFAFAQLDAKKTFYVLDNISMTARAWSLDVDKARSQEAVVTGFSYTSRTKSGFFDPKVLTTGNKYTIDPALGVIFVHITMTPLTQAWSDFYIKPTSITVSSGGSYKDVAINTEYNFSDSWDDTHSFKIVSENGTERDWIIKLKDAKLLTGKSEANDVISFMVEDARPYEIDLDRVGVIDADNKQITLNVYEGIEKFPLKMRPRIGLSDYASIKDFKYGDYIVFDSVTAIDTITVVAENSDYRSDWTIKLNNLEPPKEAGVEVLSYNITSTTDGYEFDGTSGNVDSEKGLITLYLLNKGNGALKVNHRMSLSAGAKLSGTTNPGYLSFGSINDTPKFTLRAENGESKEWTVRMIFKPQIGGANFNTWSKGQPVGWSTANNSFVTGTSVGDSFDGTNCSVLKTQNAPIVNLLAAGSTFLGTFKFNIGQQKTPKLMTWFGIPFTARPTGMSVDCNYSTPGSDKASVTIMLLNYEGASAIEFHDDGVDRGVTVVAKQVLWLDATGGWVNKTLNLEYLEPSKAVTHIHIVFSSSYRGDFFEGTVDSKLMIDNVVLNYE